MSPLTFPRGAMRHARGAGLAGAEPTKTTSIPGHGPGARHPRTHHLASTDQRPTDSSGAPAEVDGHVCAAEGRARRAGEKGDHAGHLLGFDQSLDRVRLEDDLLERLLLAEVVALGLVGQ